MKKMSREDTVPLKEKVSFGLSAIPDQLTYQIFQFLIFTFYFTVVKIELTYMLVAYIVWGIWNAINDPLLGALSERTKAKDKWGKRKYFLVISFIPLSITMILMFWVPFEGQIIKFSWFLATIILFEFFYTLFDVNVNALFPEMFPNEEKRASVNIFIKGTTIIALLLSSLLPMILVPNLVPSNDSEIPEIMPDYFLMGIVVAIIIIVVTIPFLKYGVKEREEKDEDFEKRPSFFESLKVTLTNKTFLKFVIANTMVWYCFSILPTIIPIYATQILGFEEEGIFVSLGLMIAFLIAALSLPIHRRMGAKFGMRNAFLITLGIWILTLLPYALIRGEVFQIPFLIITAAQGFPLSGALFYVDILHGDVIDEDALNYGVKRSASYYGINAFIHRISVILVIVTIFFMFGNIGWEKNYEPVVSDPLLVELGLKAIIFIFPAIALVVAIIFMKSYSLHGDKLQNMRKELAKYPELLE
ncbi:MAG: putative Major facilitator superfamily transporter [Promethearchaeota archaeon]|nr:MAG: putative Major facilitator superfamily transporter [Candidatus Lokiarchaeota archaeon]